jgi:hypothetical protein
MTSCHPHPPHGGSADRVRSCRFSGWAAPATGPLRSFLPPWKHLECNAAGLLRQGQASRRAPAGRPPLSGCQRGQDGVSGRPRCWRTTVAGPVRAGDRRRTRVLDEALAVAGGSCGGNVPPRPSCVAALPGWAERSFTGRAMCRRSEHGGRLPMAREASRVGAAREPLPWPASGRCGFPPLEGHAR